MHGFYWQSRRGTCSGSDARSGLNSRTRLGALGWAGRRSKGVVPSARVGAPGQRTSGGSGAPGLKLTPPSCATRPMLSSRFTLNLT